MNVQESTQELLELEQTLLNNLGTLGVRLESLANTAKGYHMSTGDIQAYNVAMRCYLLSDQLHWSANVNEQLTQPKVDSMSNPKSKGFADLVNTLKVYQLCEELEQLGKLLELQELHAFSLKCYSLSDRLDALTSEHVAQLVGTLVE